MVPAFLLVPALVAAAPVQTVKPLWISVLPTRPGRVYGLGVAPLAVDATAVQQASDNARADVIVRLRANIKADTRIDTTYTETKGTGAAATGTRTQNAQVGTQVQGQAAALPGLVVEETWLDRPGRTSYALAYLDLDIAQQELQTRLDTLMADLAGDRGEQGSRAKLVAAQALKKAHGELVKLDDLAGLISGGGGDPALRASVLKARLDIERRMAAARAALTFGLAPSPGMELQPEVVDVVRTAVVSQGLGWSDRKGVQPEFAITLRVRSGQHGVQLGRQNWWDHQRTGDDFIVAQGSMDLTLVDRDGQKYESMTINAKGVSANNNPGEADEKLLADYRAKLGKAVAAWLDNLAKW